MKLLPRAVVSISFLFTLCSASLFAQGEPAWVRLTSTADEFSVDVPRAGILSSKTGNDITVAVSLKDVACTLEKVKRSDAIRYLKYFKQKDEPKYKVYKIEYDKTAIARVVNINDTYNSQVVYIATPEHLYTITVTALRADNRNLLRIVDSINLGAKKLFDLVPKKESKTEETQSLDDIGSSLEVINSLKVPDANGKLIKFGKIKQEDVSFDEEQTRRLFIVRKPKAPYTDSARTNNVQGTVLAQVEFKADGSIGSIRVDPKLDFGLARNVGEVVRRIKFVPAEVDGKPVTTTRYVSYGFSIY